MTRHRWIFARLLRRSLLGILGAAALTVAATPSAQADTVVPEECQADAADYSVKKADFLSKDADMQAYNAGKGGTLAPDALAYQIARRAMDEARQRLVDCVPVLKARWIDVDQFLQTQRRYDLNCGAMRQQLNAAAGNWDLPQQLQAMRTTYLIHCRGPLLDAPEPPGAAGPLNEPVNSGLPGAPPRTPPNTQTAMPLTPPTWPPQIDISPSTTPQPPGFPPGTAPSTTKPIAPGPNAGTKTAAAPPQQTPQTPAAVPASAEPNPPYTINSASKSFTPGGKCPVNTIDGDSVFEVCTHGAGQSPGGPKFAPGVVVGCVTPGRKNFFCRDMDPKANCKCVQHGRDVPPLETLRKLAPYGPPPTALHARVAPPEFLPPPELPGHAVGPPGFLPPPDLGPAGTPPSHSPSYTPRINRTGPPRINVVTTHPPQVNVMPHTPRISRPARTPRINVVTHAPRVHVNRVAPAPRIHVNRVAQPARVNKRH